jgi:hypothetical protein
VDCSLLVRLCDMHVDCCPVIDFKRFMIQGVWGGGIWELKNSTQQLHRYEGYEAA